MVKNRKLFRFFLMKRNKGTKTIFCFHFLLFILCRWQKTKIFVFYPFQSVSGNLQFLIVVKILRSKTHFVTIIQFFISLRFVGAKHDSQLAVNNSRKWQSECTRDKKAHITFKCWTKCLFPWSEKYKQIRNTVWWFKQ